MQTIDRYDEWVKNQFDDKDTDEKSEKDVRNYEKRIAWISKFKEMMTVTISSPSKTERLNA